MNIFIDGDQALDLLLHRVKDHEDYVYPRHEKAPSCRYAHDGCPSCLVGGALFDAGVPIEVLESWDNLAQDPDEDSPAGVGIEEVPLPEGLVITKKALAIFQRAQGCQDIGYAWGTAFAQAVERSRDFGPEHEVKA